LQPTSLTKTEQRPLLEKIVSHPSPQHENINNDSNNPFNTSSGVLNLSKHISSELSFDIDGLRLFLRCPISFGLRSILNLEPQTTKNIIYQHAIFKCLNMIYQDLINEQYESLDNIRLHFEKIFDQNGISPNDIPQTAYYNAMELFEEAHVITQQRIIKNINLPYNYKINDNSNLKGEIDLIYSEENKQNLIVVQPILYLESYPDMEFQTLTFLSNVLALICKSELDVYPEKVILQYIHNKRLKEVVFHPDVKHMQNTLDLLKNIAGKIKEGKFHGESNISLCKYCAYKVECPHSVAKESIKQRNN